MDRAHVWITIAGMAAATYLTRAPLLLALSRRPLPPRVRLWLRLIPLAVLPALAIPMVLVPGGRFAATLAYPPLWGAIVVFVLATRGVNLLVTVAVGVAVVAGLRALGAPWC
jgi:branched-subunit amino acid transport protein